MPATSLHPSPDSAPVTARPAARPLLEPIKAPWIRPGVVVHEPAAPIDGLLAEFALTLRGRGFNVAGYVQRNNQGCAHPGRGCAERMEFFDLSGGSLLTVDRGDSADPALSGAIRHLRKAMREDADLAVISHFPAFDKATKSLRTTVGEGISQGMPVLTSIAGRCVGKWQSLIPRNVDMIAPDPRSLWQWWGPERLYRDLALGVAEDDVRRIVCGSRWVMVEGEHGAGLAYLPRSPKELLPRLPAFTRQSLRQLAFLNQSWDPVEMAVGMAAINAHYNRFDLAAETGNGVRAFRQTAGRVVVVGAFPGLDGILPQAAVIEADPRPGEFPIVAMDSLLPGCAAAVVNSSSLINRSLPRILRLAQDSRVALIGPSTPLTPRLHDYGIEVLGGLVVGDPDGLAAALRAGAAPREFGNFGHYVHFRREDLPWEVIGVV